MTKTAQTYSVGDWIVHSRYGIGQIKGVDVKGISGEESDYFRVESSDSTFWIPTDQIEDDQIRSVASSDRLQEAIAVLEKEPKEMSSNYKTRRKRIRQAREKNTPLALARILRDLRGHRRKKGMLNSTERTAFKTLKQRLVEEWAVIRDTQADKVERRVDVLLGLRKKAAEKKAKAATVRKSRRQQKPSARGNQSWHWWRARTNHVSR